MKKNENENDNLPYLIGYFFRTICVLEHQGMEHVLPSKFNFIVISSYKYEAIFKFTDLETFIHHLILSVPISGLNVITWTARRMEHVRMASESAA